MAKINLLPWREDYRRDKKKEFLGHLAMACLIAVGVAFIWFRMVDSSIEHQKRRNALIQTEITQLEIKVKEIQELKKRRADLIDRMKVIQDLQGTRPTIVRYFDEMVRSVPDGLFFTSITRKGNKISIQGVTESSNRVSAFMRNVDESEWFSSPNLRSIKSNKSYGDQSSVFSLELEAALPGDQDKEEQ